MAYQQNTNHYDKGEPKKDNSLYNILIGILLAGLGVVIVFLLLFYNIRKEQVKNMEDYENAVSLLREKEEKWEKNKAALERTTVSTEDLKPFLTVEQMPSFPGGEVEMQRYIGANLRYPVSAQEEGVQGRVTVRFVIEKDGAVNQVQVIRGIHRECDKEAVRVVRAMPKWIPGKHDGRAVAVYFTLPIVFRLK